MKSILLILLNCCSNMSIWNENITQCVLLLYKGETQVADERIVETYVHTWVSKPLCRNRATKLMTSLTCLSLSASYVTKTLPATESTAHGNSPQQLYCRSTRHMQFGFRPNVHIINNVQDVSEYYGCQYSNECVICLYKVECLWLTLLQRQWPAERRALLFDSDIVPTVWSFTTF